MLCGELNQPPDSVAAGICAGLAPPQAPVRMGTNRCSSSQHGWSRRNNRTVSAITMHGYHTRAVAEQQQIQGLARATRATTHNSGHCMWPADGRGAGCTAPDMHHRSCCATNMCYRTACCSPATQHISTSAHYPSTPAIIPGTMMSGTAPHVFSTCVF